MAYSTYYCCIHITKDLRQDLIEIEEFGEISTHQKIKQLLRFYKINKKK